jgi:hypothetical protein
MSTKLVASRGTPTFKRLLVPLLPVAALVDARSTWLVLLHLPSAPCVAQR